MNFVINDEIEPDTSPHYDIVLDPGDPDDPVVQNLLPEPGDDLFSAAVQCQLQSTRF